MPISDSERIAVLMGALEEAIELAEEGWEYADDYFQNKWNSDGRIENLRKVLLNDQS